MPGRTGIGRLWADEEFSEELERGALALNSDYSVDNMVIKRMVEWMAVSGDAGRQVNARGDT
jgi:hypothetical protein